MKKRARIVRNHPAYDRVNLQWVRVLSIRQVNQLEVAPLLNSSESSYLVDSSQAALWHPDNELNEARPLELIQIPLGSKVEVGPLKYTRVHGGWLAKSYDDLLEYEFSWFHADPGVTAKSANRWKVDCSTMAGEPAFLKEER